jgi:hypothetical protein
MELEEIEWVDHWQDKKKVDPKWIEQWRFIGLNNTDFAKQFLIP